MRTFFYIDGDDFLCEIETETYKIGDVFGHLVIFGPVDLLNNDHNTDQITQELIDQAADFAVGAGYIAESYSV
jgi:hypothetical protein